MGIGQQIIDPSISYGNTVDQQIINSTASISH